MSKCKSCSCEHAGWLGGHHDDPHCEYFLEEERKKRRERERREDPGPVDEPCVPGTGETSE